MAGGPLWYITCADARRVWALGPHGALVRSSNGGVTWRASKIAGVDMDPSDGGGSWRTQHVCKRGIDLRGFWLTAVACADAKHAWAGGARQSSVAVTSDGGSTWRVERLPASVSAYSIAAADVDHVFLATNGQSVLVSDDGGLTWNASGSTAWLDDAALGVAAVSTSAP